MKKTISIILFFVLSILTLAFNSYATPYYAPSASYQVYRPAFSGQAYILNAYDQSYVTNGDFYFSKTSASGEYTWGSLLHQNDQGVISNSCISDEWTQIGSYDYCVVDSRRGTEISGITFSGDFYLTTSCDMYIQGGVNVSGTLYDSNGDEISQLSQSLLFDGRLGFLDWFGYLDYPDSNEFIFRGELKINRNQDGIIYIPTIGGVTYNYPYLDDNSRLKQLVEVINDVEGGNGSSDTGAEWYEKVITKNGSYVAEGPFDGVAITVNVPTENVVLESTNMFTWLIDAASGFLAFEIAPGFTIGGIMMLCVGFALIMWLLKIFLGG